MATTTSEKTARKRTTTSRAATGTAAKPRARRRRRPTYDQIAERAYFIALEQGGADDVDNWLRAEQELAAA